MPKTKRKLRPGERRISITIEDETGKVDTYTLVSISASLSMQPLDPDPDPFGLGFDIVGPQVTTLEFVSREPVEAKHSHA